MLNRPLGKLYVYLDEHDSNLKSTYELTEGENFVGGSLFCDVKLAYANIAELHCKITLSPQGEYSIEDLSNLNHGIYRVTPKNSRQKLKPNKEYELLPERPFYLTNLYKCVFKPQTHPGIPKIYRTGSSLPAHDQEEDETHVSAPIADRKKSAEESFTRREVEKPEKTTVQPSKTKKNVKKTHETPEIPKEPQETEKEKVQTPPVETSTTTHKPKVDKEQTMQEEPKVTAPIVEKAEKEKNLIPSERVEHSNEEDVDLKQQIKKKKPEPPKEVAKPKKEPETVKEKVDIEPKNASPMPKRHSIHEQPPPPKYDKIVKEAPPREKKELSLVVTPAAVTSQKEPEKEETKLHPHPPLKEAASPALKSRKEEEKLPPLHKNVLEKKPSTGTTKQAVNVKEEKTPAPATGETKAEKEADNDFEALDDYKLKKQSETAILHRQESAKKEKEKLEAEQKRSQTRHEDELDFCEEDAFEEGLVENEPEKYEQKMPRLDYRKESLEIRRRDTDEKDYGYRRDYKDRNSQFDRDRDKRREQDRDREKSREWLQDRERDFEREMERDRERGIDRRRDDRGFRVDRPRDRDDKSGRMMPRDKPNERREEGELNIIKRRKDDDYRRQDDKRDYDRYGSRDDKEGRLDMKPDLRRQDSRQDYRHRDDRQLERKSSNYEENKFGRGSNYNRPHDSHRGPGQGYDNRLNIVKREKDPRDYRPDNRGNDPQSMLLKRPSMEEKPEEDKKEMDVMQNFPHYLAPFHQPAPPPRELRKDQPPPPRDMYNKDSRGKDDYRSERDYDLARGKSSYENRYSDSDYSKGRPPTLQRNESSSSRQYGAKSADKTPSEEKVQTPTPSYSATNSKNEEEQQPVTVTKPEGGSFELTRRKSTNESHHAQEHTKAKPPPHQSTLNEETKQPPTKPVIAASHEKPVIVEKPAVVGHEKPVVIEKPAVQDKPAVHDRPAVHDKPAVHDRPAVHDKPVVQDKPPVHEKPQVHEEPIQTEPPAKLEKDFELTRKKSNHEQRPPKVDNSKGKIAQKLEIKQANRATEEVSQPQASQQEPTTTASHKLDTESIAKYEKQASIPKKHKPNPESTAATPAPTEGNVSGKTSATQGKTTAGKEEIKEVAHDKGTKGRTQQYYVMFSGFDREDKDVEDCKKKLLHLGLKLVEERERTFNVLVLKKFKRTVKFLLAVIKGVDIVSFDWVRDCVDHDKIIPPSHHTFCDKAAESKFNFRLGASLQKARQMTHGFLKGYKVYFPFDIKPTYEEMKFLAESADGIVIRNRPLQYRDDILIILNQGDKRNAESFSEIGFTPYSSELLFSGILKQELNFDEHKLI